MSGMNIVSIYYTWKLIILCDWLIIEEISFNYSTAWSNLVNQDNNVVPGGNYFIIHLCEWFNGGMFR